MSQQQERDLTSDSVVCEVPAAPSALSAWEAVKLSRGPFIVCRQLDGDPSHYEQMRDESGQLLRFEHESAAIAIANAAPALPL